MKISKVFFVMFFWEGGFYLVGLSIYLIEGGGRGCCGVDGFIRRRNVKNIFLYYLDFGLRNKIM